MRWKDSNARSWLFKVGMEHISNDLYAEGGELIYYSKYHLNSIDQKTFVKILKKVCEWDDNDINVAILEIKELTVFI